MPQGFGARLIHLHNSPLRPTKILWHCPKGAPTGCRSAANLKPAFKLDHYPKSYISQRCGIGAKLSSAVEKCNL
jgi:hypothetical protein